MSNGAFTHPHHGRREPENLATPKKRRQTVAKNKKVRTAEEIGNQHGFTCPECHQGDGLSISAEVQVMARLCPDGTDNDGGDTTWDDDSAAVCSCGWEGSVEKLVVEDVSESTQADADVLFGNVAGPAPRIE
jgi:hypothetical protein